MTDIKVILPDGSERRYAVGTTVEDVACSIGKRLGKAAVAGKVNGKLFDLKTNLDHDLKLEIITVDSAEGLEVYRHTTAHIMAQAIKRLYDNCKLAIGPTIEDGFYYDYDIDKRFLPEELKEIENEMENIIKENLPLRRELVDKKEAIKIMEARGEDYKVELLREFEEEQVSLYYQGEFIDLCRGPHLPSTGRVKAFKLLNIAGAYWRGDENNKMLQRIYGTAFPKKTELESYLQKIEEAKKRDHRKLGKELDLFSFQEEGPGFPFFHEKGVALWNQLIDFWREVHREAGYKEVRTPLILNETLWHQSGHWDHFQENMYFTEIDKNNYAIKPMNCPGSILIYKNQKHSYREFPLKTAELGLVHRHERSGTLHGLMRVRAFTQDDAHIFMLPEQVTDELISVLQLVDNFYKVFGFNYHIELSTRPEKSMGSDQEWEMATNSLKEALVNQGLDYVINEGDGAFYGPKIDIQIEDSLGRTWQCATIQLDFQLSERFDLTYVGPDGQEHRPVMIHRVVMGSIERFIGILIEHYAGAFPTWLSPVQVQIIPISAEQFDYAEKIKQELFNKKIRVEVDDSQEKVGYKIRQAQLQQIPYMLIIGASEQEKEIVSVRERREGDLGLFTLTDFKNQIMGEIKGRMN